MLQQKFMDEYHERNRARKALKAARKAKAAPQAKKAAATGAPAPPRDDEDDEARRRPPHSPSPCFPSCTKRRGTAPPAASHAPGLHGVSDICAVPSRRSATGARRYTLSGARTRAWRRRGCGRTPTPARRRPRSRPSRCRACRTGWGSRRPWPSVRLVCGLPEVHDCGPAADLRLLRADGLSALQYQSALLACEKHTQMLPTGERAGFYLGDGPGVRTILLALS